MSNLAIRLGRLGLAAYVEGLTTKGFDTWEKILKITESDLSVASIEEGPSVEC